MFGFICYTYTELDKKASRVFKFPATVLPRERSQPPSADLPVPERLMKNSLNPVQAFQSNAVQTGDMKHRPGNGIEGAMVCTSLGSLLRPLLYFPDDVSYPQSVQPFQSQNILSSETGKSGHACISGSQTTFQLFHRSTKQGFWIWHWVLPTICNS